VVGEFFHAGAYTIFIYKNQGEPTMKRTLFATIMIASLLLSACSVTLGSTKTVKGSGVLASETRSASGFTAIELAGSADVAVSFGDSESVVVEAEDNILPLIETIVQGSKLVIRTKANTTISNSLPVRVTVTMKSLEAANLPGSGDITITGLKASSVDFDLPGSGNITADGTADTVKVNMGGSGNVQCGDLQAKSVTVTQNGSGNTTVFASENMDINFSGSGNVIYRGNPAKVNKSVTGSGSVQAQP